MRHRSVGGLMTERLADTRHRRQQFEQLRAWLDVERAALEPLADPFRVELRAAGRQTSLEKKLEGGVGFAQVNAEAGAVGGHFAGPPLHVISAA